MTIFLFLGFVRPVVGWYAHEQLIGEVESEATCSITTGEEDTNPYWIPLLFVDKKSRKRDRDDEGVNAGKSYERMYQHVSECISNCQLLVDREYNVYILHSDPLSSSLLFGT